jgi:ribosomal protein S18 acetylase RimI-like enzyme
MLAKYAHSMEQVSLSFARTGLHPQKKLTLATISPSPSVSANRMDIVRLGGDDAVQFIAMRRAGLEGDADNFRTSPTDDAQVPLAAWAERLANEHVFAVRRHGQWLAIGGLARESRVKLDHKGLIWGMYAAPEARGSGAADRLMEALIAAGEAMGLRQLQLTLMADNVRARRLYERHGFVAYATEPASVRFGVNYADEALMWKLL